MNEFKNPEWLKKWSKFWLTHQPLPRMKPLTFPPFHSAIRWQSWELILVMSHRLLWTVEERVYIYTRDHSIITVIFSDSRDKGPRTRFSPTKHTCWDLDARAEFRATGVTRDARQEIQWLWFCGGWIWIRPGVFSYLLSSLSLAPSLASFLDR